MTNKVFGYARVSTTDQSYDLQIEELKKFNKDIVIFSEKKSGKDTGRPEYQKLRQQLRKGDTLAVYKIDRLARSTRDLANIVHDLEKEGVQIIFLKEQIDFGSPGGKLLFSMLSAVAEFERDLIVERTTEGRNRAKAQGKHMGRPSKDSKAIERALRLYHNRENNGLSVNDISKQTDVPRSTIYLRVKEQKAMEQSQEVT